MKEIRRKQPFYSYTQLHKKIVKVYNQLNVTIVVSQSDNSDKEFKILKRSRIN